MAQYQLDFILNAVKGTALSSPHNSFSGFSTDNRDPEIAGRLFIPLVGENHDAHDYVAAAITAGATGILYHRWDDAWDDLKSKASFIEVGDTLVALQNFAKAWRQTFTGQVLALTGSNGKTTTKDFLTQILSEFGSVNSSHGSFNNHWGVPMTLLNTDPEAKFCVVEMGMNHAGEISKLMSIAEPDLVTVINVGRAHVGNFENGIEGVAAAKEEIYESSKPQSKLLFNIDNPWTRKMFEKYMDKISFTFSNSNFSADVYLKVKEQTATGLKVEGQIGGVIGQAELTFWGPQNVQNLAAAVLLAYVGGCKPEKIWPVLKNCHCGWGRNQWLETESGARVLFDGYNANPDSFKELLHNVAPLVKDSAKGIAIFGEMLELGGDTEREHTELGRQAGALPWQQCLFIGPSGPAFLRGWQSSKNEKKPIITTSYKDFLDLDKPFVVDPQSLIIVKGSRGGGLERVVQGFSPKDFSSK